MDIQSLISEFLQSQHGQDANAALTAQGVSPEDAPKYLSAGLSEAHDHVQEHAESGGLLGEHPGKSFFAAFAAGLVKGDGVLGAFKDGGEGVIAGRIGQALASKLGVDPSIASSVAATASPYIISFLKSKLG